MNTALDTIEDTIAAKRLQREMSSYAAGSTVEYRGTKSSALLTCIQSSEHFFSSVSGLL